MCKSLSCNYDTYLILADGKGTVKDENVQIIDVENFTGSRLRRITISAFKVFRMSLKNNYSIYHLHDPELIIYGYILKLLGKKVIFDVHEEVSNQILTKPYLNKHILRIISIAYKYIEKNILNKFFHVVTATANIKLNLNININI